MNNMPLKKKKESSLYIDLGKLMLEKKSLCPDSTCSDEEGASLASLYTLLYTYNLCAGI